jgi:hypothetical protein
LGKSASPKVAGDEAVVVDERQVLALCLVKRGGEESIDICAVAREALPSSPFPRR